MAQQPLILGSGKLYFDKIAADGTKTGEVEFGNVTNFTLQVTNETTDVKSYMTKDRGILARMSTSTTVTGSIECNFHTMSNYELVFAGDAATFAQSTGTASSETVTSNAKKGRWYSTAKRNISSVVVTYQTGALGTPATAMVGTDYVVDAAHGRVQIVASGSILEGDIVKVSYSYAAVNGQILKGAINAQTECQIRFISDNTYGENSEIIVFKASVQPDAETSFIGDDPSAFTLTFTALEDASAKAAYGSPYFVIIK